MLNNTAKGKMNVIVFIFSVVCFFQLSGLKGLANYASTGLLCVAGLFSLTRSNGRIHSETALIVFFIMFYVITSIPKIDVEYCIVYSINYFLMLSPAMMLPVFRQMIDGSERLTEGGVLRCLLLSWFAMVIISLVFYIKNPSAARVLAADGSAYAGMLVGGYQLSYGSGLICVALFGCMLRCEHRGKQKIKLLLGSAVLFWLVYLTESTLTTFATVVGMAVTLFADPKVRGKKRFIYYTVLVSAFLVAAIILYVQIEDNIASIISWLTANRDVLIYRRIKEVLNSVFLNVRSRHYSERIGLVEESLKLFTESPLIGHGYKYGNVFSLGKAYGIGNHSELFDSLAMFGIIGSLPLFLLYFKSLRYIAKHNLGVLASFLMMVLLNPFITFASSLAIFMIIPLLYQMYDKREAGKELDEVR